MEKAYIDKIKEEIEEKEIIEDEELDSLIKKKQNCSTDMDSLIDLSLQVNDKIKNNLINIIKSAVLKKYLEELIKLQELQELRKLYLNYGKGKELGDYYKKINMQNIILREREKYLDMINVFFAIVGEE